MCAITEAERPPPLDATGRLLSVATLSSACAPRELASRGDPTVSDCYDDACRTVLSRRACARAAHLLARPLGSVRVGSYDAGHMSLASRSSWLSVALVAACGLASGCGTDGGPRAESDAGNGDGGAGTGSPGPDAGTQGGLPPGAKCVVDVDARKMVSTFCLDNPVLPTCFQCVDLTDNGELDGVCVYTCRMGKQDCPEGQTCTAGTGQRTGYQPCRDATDGQQVGYCR
jgi:hypothetical protein